MKYKRICSWCLKVMGDAPPGTTGDTHGICPDCEAKMNQELEQLVKETPKK